MKRKTVSEEQNRYIAQRFLASVGERVDPNEIAAMFSVDVQFEIAGDVGALPWIGRRTRAQRRLRLHYFIRDTQCLIKGIRFDVQDILASDDLGIIESAFVLYCALS